MDGDSVGPEPDGVGGFPLAIADIETVVAGGAAPVDTRQRFAFDIGSELPEGFADAALAAAVPAGDHGVGDAPRLGEAIGQQRRALTGAGKRVGAAQSVRSAGRSTPSAHPAFGVTRSAMTSRMPMPSARAAKVSAMRCCRIGSARARTSSMDGASGHHRARGRGRTASLPGQRAGRGPRRYSFVDPWRCHDRDGRRGRVRGSRRPPIQAPACWRISAAWPSAAPW
jgi:hypothetical protein